MKIVYHSHTICMQVLSHIAERLQDLHKAGYVHRDIKPGNIMFLPRTKRWTLIDFGCAAATGSHPRTGFSLFYAAPEALKAYLAGEVGVVATEALDAWSLGVLAFELFSGQPVFDHMRPKDEVRVFSSVCAGAVVQLECMCMSLHLQLFCPLGGYPLLLPLRVYQTRVVCCACTVCMPGESHRLYHAPAISGRELMP